MGMVGLFDGGTKSGEQIRRIAGETFWDFNGDGDDVIAHGAADRR